MLTGRRKVTTRLAWSLCLLCVALAAASLILALLNGRTLGKIFVEEGNLNSLTDDLVGVVRDAMQPAHVSLWLREPKLDPEDAETRP